MPLAALDALAWSSLWLALAAAALAAAASHALEVRPAPAVLGLAFGGTVVVYVIDRLRDLARDRASAPERAAFVERHRSALIVLAGLGGGLAAGSALALRPGAALLALGVGALGLAHRRLKRWLLVKPAYLTFAWTAVPVGLPAAHDPSAQHVGFAAAVVFASVLANVALSNLRDGEGLAARLGRRRTLGAAAAILAGAAGRTARPCAGASARRAPGRHGRCAARLPPDRALRRARRRRRAARRCARCARARLVLNGNGIQAPRVRFAPPGPTSRPRRSTRRCAPSSDSSEPATPGRAASPSVRRMASSRSNTSASERGGASSGSAPLAAATRSKCARSAGEVRLDSMART